MLLQGNLQGMQHLGLPVTNLERSKAFYMEFGFVERMRIDVQGKKEPIPVAMLQKADLMIEMYQLEREEREKIALRQDGHVDHIAMNVSDIEKAYREIKAAGLEIIEENAPAFLPFWSRGVKFFTVRGPDGEKIEFSQILK